VFWTILVRNCFNAKEREGRGGREMTNKRDGKEIKDREGDQNTKVYITFSLEFSTNII
jgi:hypothetical protein